MKLVLKGGRVIDPSQSIDSEMDVIIEKGRISGIERDFPQKESGTGVRIIDCRGMLVVPGLIDMHTHLREPGFEYKETVKTGSDAALAGGFTSIACMANTDPVNDNRSVTEFILRQARAADGVHVFPVAAVSRNLEGAVLTEFTDLLDAGAVALSDDGKPIVHSGLMRNALEYAHSLGLPLMSHCEDPGLSTGGHMNESLVSTELGLPGIPAIAEDIMVLRDIAIAEYTKISLHIAHVSTAGSVRAVRDAKARGVAITAETAPHYFSLTDEALAEYSTNCKVYPPLRTADDAEAVKEGLKDGTLDAIASDHAPHSSIEKDVEFEYAATGMIGLETSLALSYALVHTGILTERQLVEKMSTNPAAILRIPKGTLQTGVDADVTLIDPGRTWTVDTSLFRSKSRNSPFQGWKLKGKAVMTIVSGKIKYDER